jgi:shikimate dehydrogenase
MIRAGVVGWPVSHSLSPLIHGAWIHGAGLSATYDLLPAETGADFDTLVAHASDGLIQGFNVTAPWKLRALASADEATPTARRAGSANLLTFRQGRILADSTDGVGVLSALKSQAPHLSLPDARVTVLGAGGAARAAAAALIDAGARVGVINRSADRARDLADALDVELQRTDDIGDADLVLNALPVDPGLDVAVLKPEAVVMDMTYRPLHPPLLSAARRRGLTTVDGLAMLIGQARPSFAAIYGVGPPDVDVRALCLAALETAQ